MKATCTICEWSEKAAGVYHAHNLSRIHKQQQHPAAFAFVVRHENRVRDAQAKVVAGYGQAVKPLNMN